MTCGVGSNILVIPGVSGAIVRFVSISGLCTFKRPCHGSNWAEPKGRNKKLKGWKIDIPRDIKAIMSILSYGK